MTTYIIIRDKGCVPDQKGPFPDGMVKGFLKEALEARMGSFVTVATVYDDGRLSIQDGPECLEMMDRRHKHLARKHRASTAVRS